MKLNTTSYVHVTIRQLCLQLELLSGMKLITELSEEFDEIRFIDKYGYIVIDYKKEACFTLSHRITKKETDTISDLMIYLKWLETGRKYNNEEEDTEKVYSSVLEDRLVADRRLCNKNVTYNFRKNVDKVQIV